MSKSQMGKTLSTAWKDTPEQEEKRSARVKEAVIDKRITPLLSPPWGGGGVALEHNATVKKGKTLISSTPT